MWYIDTVQDCDNFLIRSRLSKRCEGRSTVVVIIVPLLDFSASCFKVCPNFFLLFLALKDRHCLPWRINYEVLLRTGTIEGKKGAAFWTFPSSSHHSGRRCSRLGVRWYLMWRGPVSSLTSSPGCTAARHRYSTALNPGLIKWHSSQRQREKEREREHMARRKNKDSVGQRKEAEERRRWWREFIKRKCKREKVEVGAGDVRGRRAEMAGWERARDGSKKMEPEKGRIRVFSKKLMLCAEAYSSWMVVTLGKIREWEGVGHGGAVKYSWMKIPTLRVKVGLWVGCDVLRMGMAAHWSCEKAWQDAGLRVVESIYHLTPPISTSPPTPPPCSSSILSASQPFSQPSATVFHCRRASECHSSISTALLWMLNLCSLHISALFLHQLSF